MERRWLFTFLILFGANLVALDIWVVLNQQKDKAEMENVSLVENNNEVEDRLDNLENQIKKLSGEEELVPEVTVDPVEIKTVTQSTTKTKHVSYVNVSGGFGQIAYDWMDVPASEFYFNKSDYDGLKEVKFESNMKLLNGNGMAYVRLFDVTHGSVVTGSQVETGNQNNTVVTSTALNFMDGKNLIRVQIKSLTADTTVFNSGRLVITSEY